MSLRKSGTFSSPKSLSTDICSLENQPFMPRRSPTSTECLEALVNETANYRRVADILKDFDQKLAGHKTASTSGVNILADPEVLPVPGFVLDSATIDTTPMDIDSKPSAVERSPHEHASDSGLGSSIGGSKYGKPSLRSPVMHAPPSDIYKDAARTQNSSLRDSIITSVTSAAQFAVTSSIPTLSASDQKHTLGEYACKQIHDTIIKPILAEPELKDFHSLIQDVPRRIGEKSICNLRDLEKTLIFLAPVSHDLYYIFLSANAYCIPLVFQELSLSPASYQHFGERVVQLLHATVDHLSEQDQRLPSDRPYTNNYFLDLIEQIRRYAAIMAATRRKEAKGEDLDDLDYSRYDQLAFHLYPRTNLALISDEKITLRGGLSHNGRPVELVREKNGKVLPLGGSNDDAYKVSKRALDNDSMDEDEVTRSMARRRKSDKPGDVLHTCRDCKKEFKRPCDLTKHEKTHSRPWKCSEEKCKYFDLGWPTEKERDRHMNDKHSAAPAQYKCLYPPCTYASKRESNCKQHMEKAHGWEYVRSKSNGRKKAPAQDNRSPTTPLTPFLGTPLSATLTTPVTPFAPSPQMPMVDTFDYYNFGTPALSVQGFQDDFRRDSVTTDGSHFTYSSGHSPTEPTSFDDAVTPEDTAINHNDVFNNCALGTNYSTGFQQQQLTPALSTGFDFEPLRFTTNSMANGIPHLSPLAQPDVTLFSPQVHMDEGFGDMDMHTFSRPTEDFTLFDTTQPSNMAMNNTANFFPDFNQLGGQFDTLYAEPTTTLDDLMGNNFGAQ
jgi:uncharacterized C2H2 Zn-finger protein